MERSKASFSLFKLPVHSFRLALDRDDEPLLQIAGPPLVS